MNEIIESLKSALNLVRDQKNKAVNCGLYNTAQLFRDNERKLLEIIVTLEYDLYSVEA